MTINFFKFQGAGNDFIFLDGREVAHGLSKTQIAFLCHRHFGIGADGLIVLQLRDGFDFEMIYFNSDGQESSMCGNGGRCLAAFAKHLGIKGESFSFLAIDGPHEAKLLLNKQVALKMSDVPPAKRLGLKGKILNTGSPHLVLEQENTGALNMSALNMVALGRKYRYSKRFDATGGINVNAYCLQNAGVFVRTYERGVEDETLACGTGVTAVALVCGLASPVAVETLGGQLSVAFNSLPDGSFNHVWLTGPAEFVFEGRIKLP